jgi:hypothetical protein
MLLVMLPALAVAQRGGGSPHPPHPRPPVVVRGHVFIGGYFYDPFYGPYPWWPRAVYPYWYFPVYDYRAEVRVRVTPKDALVYVDGFYAGIVDDFDGVFQSLPLSPGGHRIVVYLQGYRTVRHNIYLQPGSTFQLREAMEPLPEGVPSEPPELAPTVPAPPAGTYRLPPGPPTVAQTVPMAPQQVAGFGTLDLHVQPAGAEVTIDGQRWLSSDAGHFVVQMPEGRHHIEVSGPGLRPFATDVEIREGEALPLNVSLLAATS